MNFLTHISCCAALASLPLLCSSCSSEQEDAESALTISPITVSEAEFYAARYNFSFVTKSGQLLKLVPQGGSGAGGVMPGLLTVDGQTASVSLQYELDLAFIPPDPEEEEEEEEDGAGDLVPDDYDNSATGIITLTFNNQTGDSIALLEALGVTLVTGEGEEPSLPVSSGFRILLSYINPDGTDQTARVAAFNPFAVVPISWISSSMVENVGVDARIWLESDFLHGSYLVERNF